MGLRKGQTGGERGVASDWEAVAPLIRRQFASWSGRAACSAVTASVPRRFKERCRPRPRRSRVVQNPGSAGHRG